MSPSSPPLLLPAAPADAPALAALINRAYRGEASRQGWTTEAHLLDGPRIGEAQLRNMFATSNSLFIKYLLGNELVGCAYLQQQGAVLYLSTLAVAPEAQAQGTGRALLLAAEAEAHRRGCTHLRISVLAARPELLAWYERRGYQRTGEAEAFPDTLAFGTPRQPLTLLGLTKAITVSS